MIDLKIGALIHQDIGQLNESRQLFASKYMTYLPTEEELEKELRCERNILEDRKVNQK